MLCDIALCSLVSVQLSSELGTKAPVISVRVICWLSVPLCEMWLRHNEGSVEVVLNTEVNGVSVQLTQIRASVVRRLLHPL